MGQVMDFIKKWQTPDGSGPPKQGLQSGGGVPTTPTSPPPANAGNLSPEDLLKQKQAQADRINALKP